MPLCDHLDKYVNLERVIEIHDELTFSSQLDAYMYKELMACSATDQKVVGSSPANASLIPEMSFIYVQLRVRMSLCSLLVHPAKCT